MPSRRRAMSDRPERTARANVARRALRDAHPRQFASGVTCGLENLAVPKEFSEWSAAEREAFFAGAYVGYARRQESEAA
jgi:hypothetical protein